MFMMSVSLHGVVCRINMMCGVLCHFVMCIVVDGVTVANM